MSESIKPYLAYCRVSACDRSILRIFAPLYRSWRTAARTVSVLVSRHPTANIFSSTNRDARGASSITVMGGESITIIW